MTQTSSLTKHTTGFAPLFTFSLKQFWTTILLFAIILFFAMPVPALMAATDARGYLNPGSVERALNDLTEGIRLFIVPLMSALAVVASCARFGYLKNKVAVDYYHSLPVRRSRLYLTQLAVGAASLAIPYLFNILLTLLVAAVNGCINTDVMSNLLVMSAEVLIYPAFFGALATLVGMVTGMSAVHLILTAVAMFIVPVFWLLSVAFVDIFNENMWLNWYCSEDTMMAMSPVFRFLMNFTPISLPEGIAMLLAAAAMFVGAYFVYTIRKSERAGTPVVFMPLGEVIKFVLVFIGTIGGGLIFYYIMDSFFWTVFGMLCGTVLVFMLTNTILQKTAKAMFRGWKALCAYGVIIAICFTVLVTNAFGVNTYVPSPGMTAKIEVDFDGSARELIFTNRACVEALHRIYTDGQQSYLNYPSPIWNYEVFTLNIVFHPYVGMPVAKSVTIYNKSQFTEEFRTLLDSEEFAEQYCEHFAPTGKEEGHLRFELPRYYFDRESGNIYRDGYAWHHLDLGFDLETSPESRLYGLDLIATELENVNFDWFQQQVYDTIIMDYERYSYINIPIHTSMTTIFERWLENDLIVSPPDEILDGFADVIDSVSVYKVISTDGEASAAIVSADYGIISSPDGPTVTVEEVAEAPEANELVRTVRSKQQIREILAASINPFGNYYDDVFTFADNEYYAEFEVNITDFYSEDFTELTEASEDMKQTIADSNTSARTYRLAFLADSVPAFIPDLFE